MQRSMKFEDSPRFYKELKEALERKENIVVVTDFKRFDEVPERLKEIFELNKSRSDGWMNLTTGMFITGAVAHSMLNANALYVLAGAGVGAAAGGAVAGPPGAVVGAGVGAIVGVIAAASMRKRFDVKVKISPTGGLSIEVSGH